jgi:hypothetical protein
MDSVLVEHRQTLHGGRETGIEVHRSGTGGIPVGAFILDVDGLSSTILQAGHLDTVKHTTVLKALEHQANRFQKKGEMIEAKSCLHS